MDRQRPLSTIKNPTLKQAVEVLRSNDYTNYDHHYRQGRIELMGNMGDEALPFLMELLYDDTATAMTALETLEKMGATDAIPYALQALANPSSGLRSFASSYLATLNVKESIPLQRDFFLQAEYEHERETAAKALGTLRAEDEMHILLEWLEEETKEQLQHSHTIIYLYNTLGQCKSTEALPLLFRHITDNEADRLMREKAAQACHHIGILDTYVPSLLNIIQDTSLYDSLRGAITHLLILHAWEDVAVSCIQLLFDESTENRSFRTHHLIKALQERPAEALKNTIEALFTQKDAPSEALVWAYQRFQETHLQDWIELFAKSEYLLQEYLGSILATFPPTPLLLNILRTMLVRPSEDTRRQGAKLLSQLEEHPQPLDILMMLRSKQTSLQLAACSAIHSKYGDEACWMELDIRVRQAFTSLSEETLFSAICEVLPDATGEFRGSLIYNLGNMNRPETEAMLMLYAKDDEPYSRVAAISFLGSRTSPAITKLLIEALDDPDKDVRVNAIRALEKQQNQEAVPAIIEHLLHDPHDRVRFFAGMALEKIASTESIPALLQSLHDNDHSVAVRGMNALVAIVAPWLKEAYFKAYSPHDIPPEDQPQNRFGETFLMSLRDNLMGILASPKADTIQGYACLLLGVLGRKDVVPHLIEWANRGHNIHHVCYALATLNTQEGNAYIFSLLESSDYTSRQTAQQTLDGLGPHFYGPTLYTLAKDQFTEGSGPDITVIDLLAETEDTEVAKLLFEHIHSVDPDIQLGSIIKALGKIKYIPAMETLCELYDDEELEGYTQVQITEAIGQIPSEASIPFLHRAFDEGTEDIKAMAFQYLLVRDPMCLKPTFREAYTQYIHKRPEHSWSYTEQAEGLTRCMSVPEAWRHSWSILEPYMTTHQLTQDELTKILEEWSHSSMEALKSLREYLIEKDERIWEDESKALQASCETCLDAWRTFYELFQGERLDHVQEDWERTLFEG
ncbi:MAG: hypothetical protein CL920_38775 [Deltaproteobacteria bacterium]|nr:hypothetical protein [Deltaproteobacteria bacterium]|tara:strand:+ start:319 stop:3225 length:2907 start_codon:yes stop_codon:yes gene_type:complete